MMVFGTQIDKSAVLVRRVLIVIVGRVEGTTRCFLVISVWVRGAFCRKQTWKAH